MRLYPDYIEKIKYENIPFTDDINFRIIQLVQRLQDEPHMSMVRDVFDDVEIIVMKQFHIENRKEYIRISVSRQREELFNETSRFQFVIRL